MNLPQPAVSEEVSARPVTTSELARYTPVVCWVMLVATLLMITLKIVGYGVLPAGDARRHAAKGLIDKPYSQIVVMRPEYKIDHSPGWEWLLRQVHKATGWNQDGLMTFSIIVLLSCIFLMPIAWLRRPEAWLCALLAEMVALPELMVRFIQTRPLLITEGVLIAILFSWRNANDERADKLKFTLTSIGIALSVWMHGAWYLWVLPLLAFAIARQWNALKQLTACTVVGVFAGAALTGHPFTFLEQAVFIVQTVAKQEIPQWMLVGEFQPSRGEFETLLLMTAVGVIHFLVKKRPQKLFTDPVFCMAVVGWVLGFRADRFWADWGIPAALVWLTLQIQDILESTMWRESSRRIATSALVAIPLFLTATNDLDRRYTKNFTENFLDYKDPQLAGWFPDGDGIFYCAQMEFFYSTFYKNPTGQWRYILGFEPALMPPDDLLTYRRIQFNRSVAQAYEPWVDKMTSKDRLVVQSAARPVMKNLEWINAGDSWWIGRYPR